jgi:hypothetical protein
LPLDLQVGVPESVASPALELGDRGVNDELHGEAERGRRGAIATTASAVRPAGAGSAPKPRAFAASRDR